MAGTSPSFPTSAATKRYTKETRNQRLVPRIIIPNKGLEPCSFHAKLFHWTTSELHHPGLHTDPPLAAIAAILCGSDRLTYVTPTTPTFCGVRDNYRLDYPTHGPLPRPGLPNILLGPFYRLI